MVSHHFCSQLVLFALLWLCIIFHLLWSRRGVSAPATPAALGPLQPKRHRSREPKPFEGLTHKPHCTLCERETAHPPAPPPAPPDPMPRRIGGRVASILAGTFVPMPVVPTGAGSVWAICRPMAILIAVPGASFTARRARGIFGDAWHDFRRKTGVCRAHRAGCCLSG